MHREHIAVLQHRISEANARAKAEGRDATQAQIEAIIAAWYEEFAGPSADGRPAGEPFDTTPWPGDRRAGPHDVPRNLDVSEQLETVDAYWDPGKSEWVAVVRGRAAEPLDEDRVLDGPDRPGLLRQAEEGIEEIRKSAEYGALAGPIAEQDVIAARAATDADIARAEGAAAAAEADRLETERLPEVREAMADAVAADAAYRETYERSSAPDPDVLPSPVPRPPGDPVPVPGADPAEGVGWQTPSSLPDADPLPPTPVPGEPSPPVEDDETAERRFRSRGLQLRELRRERKERRLDNEEGLRWQVLMFAGELQLQAIVIIILLEGLAQAFGLEPSISDTVDLPFTGMSILLAFGVGVLMQLAASAAGVLLARAVRQQLAVALLLLAMTVATVRLVGHLDDVRAGGKDSLFLTDVSLLTLLAGVAIAFTITIGKAAVRVRAAAEAAVAKANAYADLYGTWIKDRATDAIAEYRALLVRIDELRRTAEYAEMRALEAMAKGIEAQQRKQALEGALEARYRAEAGARELRVAQGVIAYLAARYWALRELVAPVEMSAPADGAEAAPVRIGRWLSAAAAAAFAGVAAGVLIPSWLAVAAGLVLAALVLLAARAADRRARRAAALAHGGDGEAPPDHAVGLADAPDYRFLPHDSRPRHQGETTENTYL